MRIIERWIAAAIRGRLQGLCLAIAIAALPTLTHAQPAPSDPNLVKIRQVLCDEFTAAMAKGDLHELAIHYAPDVVLVSTVPDFVGPFVGRPAAMGYLEALPKRLIRYKSVAQHAGLRPDGSVWTEGVATFWVKGTDGALVRRWTRWFDTIRKTGDRWEVVMQINASLPARPSPDPTGD